MMSRNESPAIVEEDGGNQLDMKVKKDKFPDIKNEAKKIIVRKSSMEDPETLRLSLLKEIAEKRSTSVGAPEASKPPPTTTSAPMIDTNMLSDFNPPKLTSLPSAHVSVPLKVLSSLGTAVPQPYITTNSEAMTISTPSTTLKTCTESPFLMPIPHINPMVFKPMPQTSSGAITSVQTTQSTNLKASRRKRKRARQKMRLNQKLQTQRQKRQLKRQAKALNKLDNPNLISIPQAMLRIKTTATKSSTTSNAPPSIVPTPKQRMQLMKTLKMDQPDLTSPPPQNLLIKTLNNKN
uniref:Uncharacterized protein n=1 Tax=Ciona savignyi TaxID=51511 RepID=H2YXJ6_CIOSA